MYDGTTLMRSKRVSQRFLLEAIQRGDPFVYALLTRQGAIKIGVSTNLFNRKRTQIAFGGTEHLLAYMPGTYDDEQALHQSIPSEYRIFGKREYYYPVPEILPFINVMREWMGVRPLKRKALPRLASCTFHRQVQDREAAARRGSTGRRHA